MTMRNERDVLVRNMTVDDCESVAKVRVRGWQAAYAGLMPQSYLDAMLVPELRYVRALGPSGTV